MLRVSRLSKRFGKHTAVDQIDFEVEEGETMGLLGPNGAGKSTTMNLICGFLNPDDGDVLIAGQHHPNTAAGRRVIGVSPQSLSLYSELSARENLAFFGAIYDLHGGELRQRCDWALDFAQLTDRQHERVKNFSGGMKRRLNLACAMVHDPKLLLLDEPTVGVDPQSRNHIFDCIRQLQDQGRTIIYTTHYMEEAQRLCDNVAVMDQGRFLAKGTIDQLLQEHGGISQVEAQVRELPTDVELPGSVEDNVLRFQAADPIQEITRLVGQQVVFGALKIEDPNLESVFLNLTGRSLRDS